MSLIETPSSALVATFSSIRHAIKILLLTKKKYHVTTGKWCLVVKKASRLPSKAYILIFNYHNFLLPFGNILHNLALTGTIESSQCTHGDHFVHETDCHKFYKCVWTKKIEVTCPQGTVFNQNARVCDFLSRVPRCHPKVSSHV